MKTSRFFETFAQHRIELPSQAKVTQFLSPLLTPKKIEEIINRLEIIRLLKEGKLQSGVAQKIKAVSHLDVLTPQSTQSPVSRCKMRTKSKNSVAYIYTSNCNKP